MFLADHKHHGFPHDHPVAVTITAGLLAIAVALALYALASTLLGFAPRLAPIAYLSLAVVAVMLLINFAVTLLRNEMQAGLALLGFWALVFCGAFVGFQLLT